MRIRSIVTITTLLLVTSCTAAPPLPVGAADVVPARAPEPTTRIIPPDGASVLVDQRFDIRVETPTGELRVELDGKDIGEWDGRSRLTEKPLDPAPRPPLHDAKVFLSRDWSFPKAGHHTLRALSGGKVAREVAFDVVDWKGSGGVRNVILLIGDGMGVGARTAARVVSRGLSEGRYRNGLLEMDTMQATGLVTTSSFSAMVTDSAPGASCYSTGQKGVNGHEGVYPDNTDDDALESVDPESDRFFDNPRVENIAEYLHRLRGVRLGVVTTADVTDATPAAFAVHTANRAASTRIADDFFDRREQTGLAVLMGGGRRWFDTSGRRAAKDNPGVNPARDLIGEFKAAGYAYADTVESLRVAAARKPDRLLGLFAPSTMPVAFDKLGRGASREAAVPMLDEMARVALDALDASSPKGFFLMIEGASIDKQEHAEDSDRAIFDTIEFDRAVGVAKRFAEAANADRDPNNDTLVVVTADHETGGFSLFGVTSPNVARGSRDQARTYVDFPEYTDADRDGYPDDADPQKKIVMGYGSGTDRYDDYHSNRVPAGPSVIGENGRVAPNPKRDGPADPDVDSRRGTLLGGQIENNESGHGFGNTVAAHTANDVPITASGPGALQFVGVQDNTDVFFKIMRAFGGSYPRVYYDGEKPR